MIVETIFYYKCKKLEIIKNVNYFVLNVVIVGTIFYYKCKCKNYKL